MAFEIAFNTKKLHIKELGAITTHVLFTSIIAFLFALCTGVLSFEHITTNYFIHPRVFSIVITVLLGLAMLISIILAFTITWYRSPSNATQFVAFYRLQGLDRALIYLYHLFVVFASTMIIAFSWHHYRTYSLQGAPETYDNIFAINSWYNYEGLATNFFQINAVLAFLAITTWWHVYYPSLNYLKNVSGFKGKLTIPFDFLTADVNVRGKY